MSKLIPLTQGKFAIVDDEDFELISKRKWYAEKNRNMWYAKTNAKVNGKPKSLRMHCVILNALPKFQCDHKNGNGLDNRKSNLRVCTVALNQANQKYPIRGKSKYRGVAKNGNKWAAYISKKRIHLGSFATETKAAKAYDIAARQKYGEFAQPNFEK